MNNENQPKALIVRHENDSAKELSACGHRYRLLSKEDQGIAAWAHAVEIDGAKPHYHKKTTELYYVLEGKGYVTLDDKEEVVDKVYKHKRVRPERLRPYCLRFGQTMATDKRSS